jgi:outer membrane protein assembly factor BamB
MTEEYKKPETKQHEVKRIVLNTIIISGVFTVMISLLLLFNFMQLTLNDPIESETMKALVERLSADLNNEQLREEIRSFDLIVRKAYFTGKWQIEIGGLLLLLGGIVLVIALRYYSKITSAIEEPEQEPIKQQTSRVLASRWLLGLGASVVVFALAASLLSINHLDNYEEQVEAAISPASTVEVVDLFTETPAEQQDEQTGKIPVEISTDVAEAPAADDEPATPIEAIENQPQTAGTFPSLADIQKQYNTFRGPLGQAISKAKNPPMNWNVETGENILWKADIPLNGYSSPVIWNDKLFVTGANNNERWVYCYNSNTGEMLWQQQANNIPGSPATAPRTTDDTGLAAPSVVTDGQRVAAIFGTGDVIAFDMNGNRLWARNLGVPDNHYGHSSSLMAWKQYLVVQFDGNRSGRMLAVNIRTGETIWDIQRSSNISWASPILIEVDGKMQIVTSTEPTVAGYELETGKELWKVDCMMGEVGPSPGFGNGLIFAANEYATLAAIDPVEGKIVWQDNYYLPEVSSPVVADGMVFIATTYGVFAAFDVHSGNMYWEADFNDGFYSSPIVVNGKIYAIDMSGNVHIMKVSREAEMLASIPLGRSITTTPSFTNGRMYVRANDVLFCIGK